MGNEQSKPGEKGGAEGGGGVAGPPSGVASGERAGSYRADPANADGSAGGGGAGAGGSEQPIADPSNISELQDTSIAQAPQPRLTKDDFTLIKTIGKGSFGKVLMVKKNDTGRVYAMKVLNKEKVIARKQYEHTLSERKIQIGRAHV